MSSMRRIILRSMGAKKELPHNRCPHCHKKLTLKPGYGLVCEGCGHEKPGGEVMQNGIRSSDS